MNNVKKYWWNVIAGGGGASFVEPTPPDEDFIMKFNLWSLSTMFQERSVSPSGIPTTAVNTTTNPVGTILDQSRSCVYLRATGATAIPTLGVNGILFDGSNDQLEVPSSQTYLKGFHAVSPIGGIRFKIRKLVDGTTRVLIGNEETSTLNYGFHIQLTSTNKLQIIGMRGTSGVPMYNYTTTEELLVADGEITIHVNINGTGSNACSVRINGTTETFTSLSGATNDSTSTFKVGGIGSFANFQLCESLEFVNRVWTSDEMTAYEAQSTARTTDDFGLVKQWQLDFWDSTKCWADAGRTTPVTNTSVLRAIDSSISIPSVATIQTKRNATAASDAAAPQWLSDADGNGNGGAYFDGDGGALLTFGEDPWIELGGTSTSFMVFLQEDLDNGSHIRISSPEYMVITGKDYIGNPLKPYVVAHQSAATEPLTATAQTGVDIIVERRRGATGQLGNRAGTLEESTNYGKCNSPTFGGSTQGADWYPDGKLIRLEKYFGYMSDADVALKIAELRNQFTIPSTI